MTDQQKCGSLILEAIDQLRKRKARPDLDRISHMLERRHGVKGPEVNEELTRLVQEGAVIKVDYKGNTSYRNAAKWPKSKSQLYGYFYNSSDVSSLLLDAVRDITKPGTDQPLRSASLQEIENYMLNRDSQSFLNLATLRVGLQNEVDRQHLHLLPNGEYILLKTASSEGGSPVKSFSELKLEGTPPKRCKSDSDSMCQENSSNSSDESPPNQCGYCLFYSTANRKGEPEELLTCRDCGAKAHPSCMEYTKLLYENYPQPQNWQCPDCKTCCVCDEIGENSDVLTCYICFNGYHMNCHNPIVNSKPTGTWLCSSCDKEKMPKIKKSSDQYNSDSFLSKGSEEFLKSLERYPSTIPVAKKWTIDEVAIFLTYIGFEEEAPAFREQEIDGLSLLLMKRNDVLTGLGIKLGPALKIYKHVVNLQSKISEN